MFQPDFADLGETFRIGQAAAGFIDRHPICALTPKPRIRSFLSQPKQMLPAACDGLGVLYPFREGIESDEAG
jgi:hypothetical protein